VFAADRDERVVGHVDDGAAVEVVTLEQVGLGAALAFAVHELGVSAVAFEDAFASLAPFAGSSLISNAWGTARRGCSRSGPADARAFLDLREPPVELLTPRRRIRQQ
jgi:hypothetical protein